MTLPRVAGFAAILRTMPDEVEPESPGVGLSGAEMILESKAAWFQRAWQYVMLAAALGLTAWPIVAGAPLFFWVSSTLMSAPMVFVLVWATVAIRPVAQMAQQHPGPEAKVVFPWQSGVRLAALAGPPSVRRWPGGQACFLSVPATLHGQHVWLLMVLDTETAEHYVQSRSLDE
jgi:hypothetical protein